MDFTGALPANVDTVLLVVAPKVEVELKRVPFCSICVLTYSSRFVGFGNKTDTFGKFRTETLNNRFVGLVTSTVGPLVSHFWTFVWHLSLIHI